MFVAYFDESGTQRGSPVVAVAGFLAPEKQWARLQVEWAKVLQDEKLSYFHMTDWENRQGQFKGWDNDRRIAVYRRLIGIIQRRITIPVFSGVKTKDYAEVKIWERFHNMPKSPYAFCSVMCMRLLVNWADAVGHQEPIAYIFESGAMNRGELMAGHSAIMRDEKNKRRYRLGSFTYADKRELSPLQAADILAYEAYKYLRNELEGKVRQQRKSLTSLFEKMRIDHKSCMFMPRKGLEDYLASIS